MGAGRYEAAQARYLAEHGVEARSRYLEVEVPTRRGGTETLRTHVLESGEGPPLLLWHGGGGLAAGWAPLMAKLSGFRLIAPDRPGCGLTDGFDYRREDFRQHAVAFVEGVYRGLGLDSALVVANSMGARWSTWHALERPDRMRGLVALGVPALVLETGAPLPMRLLGVPGLGRLMMALEPGGERGARTLWQRMGHDTMELTPAFLELSDALSSGEAYAHTWRTLIGAVLSPGGVRPGLSLTEAQLARLAMPTTFVIGDNDPFGGPDVGRRAAAACPDGQFEAAGRGHLPWLDDSAGCADAVTRLVARLPVDADPERARA